jgi:hypothetical protein
MMAVVIAVGNPANANGDEPPFAPTNSAFVKQQAKLLPLANRLEEAASGKGGLAGISLDVPAGVVNLYWKGKVPKVVQVAAEKAPEDTRVKIHRANHAAEELRANAKRILEKWGLSSGGPVHRITPLPDGSGLEAGLVSSPATSKQPVVSDPWVVRTTTEEVPALYDGRWGGDSPFEGGIGIGGCSVSFSGNRYWSPRLVTAAHCFDNVGDPVYTGNLRVGHVEEIDRRLDSAVISVDAPSTVYPAIWDGGVKDGTEYTKPVVGAQAPRVGALVCTSGAYSGAHCDIKIKNTGTTLDWGTHKSYSVSIADQLDGHIAAGSGDSGGPVFMLTGDYSATLATGVIIGGDAQRSVPCTYYSKQCSSRLFFTDFTKVKSRWGLN